MPLSCHASLETRAINFRPHDEQRATARGLAIQRIAPGGCAFGGECGNQHMPPCSRGGEVAILGGHQSPLARRRPPRAATSKSNPQRTRTAAGTGRRSGAPLRSLSPTARPRRRPLRLSPLSNRLDKYAHSLDPHPPSVDGRVEQMRSACHAGGFMKRNKLLELARVWSDAALVEEQFATEARPLSPQVA